MAGPEGCAPIDLAQFRAGRHWRAWDRHWEIICCHLDDDAAGTTVSLELKEASPVRGVVAVECHGPFSAGRQAWEITSTDWEAECHGLRVQLQRAQELDRPHPIVAAIFGWHLSR